MAVTESSIQNLIASRYRNCRRLITPNAVMPYYGWESDLLSVTDADMVYEYEIKISRADFRKEVIKFRHQYLCNWQNTIVKPTSPRRPNRFYYVSPTDVIPVADVPNYAGLLYVADNALQEVKPAPWLHRFPITDKQRRFLERGLMLRYWQGRVPGTEVAHG